MLPEGDLVFKFSDLTLTGEEELLDHHGSHRSSSSRTAYEHEYRRHDSHDRKERDHHHRDEFRHESAPSRISSRMSSRSPPRSRASGYTSPECTTVPRPKKEGDVIENMNNAFTDGPLESLKHCVHDRIKVMVWIRNHRGIRGICTGFVLAFDKFWNLVMQDVDEVYQKIQNPKTPFLQSVEPGGCSLPEAKLGKKKKKSAKPKEKVVKKVEISESARQEARERKKKRKEEEKKRRAQDRAVVCKRNLKKLFVRGDNVVLVKVME